VKFTNFGMHKTDRWTNACITRKHNAHSIILMVAEGINNNATKNIHDCAF